MTTTDQEFEPSRQESLDGEWSARITVDPKICGGRPCIRGMRIRVSDIIELLADGVSFEKVLADFPYLQTDDLKAALRFAASAVDHRIIEAA